MNGNPALRVLDIVRNHKALLLVSALLGAGGGAVAGLTAPTLYQAESMIKIDPPKRTRTVSSAASALLDSSQSDAGVALRNAVMLATSKDVLEASVDSLVKTDSFDYEAAFPRSIHLTDLKIKLRLMAKRLGAKKAVPHKLDPTNLDKEALVGLIRSQVRVSSDSEAQIMRLDTEASTADLAQRMCSIMTDEFIKLSLQRDKLELTKEEDYLENTLKLQRGEIEEVERKMRDIRKQHPEIIGAGDGLKSLFALRHQELSHEAERVDQEIKVGEHLRDLDEQRLGSVDYRSALEMEAVRKRVEKELGELEFKRIEYTRVLNYPSNHPDIVALDARAERLRSLLTTAATPPRVLRSGVAPSQAGDQGRSIEQMLQFMVVNNEKLRTLKAQQTQLGHALLKNTENLKKNMPIESEIASLARELTAHLEVSTELRRHLEEVKIQLVGFGGSASLLAAPILPVVPTSLSTPKRMLFGLVVGMAFALSALFLLDLINPRLRLIDDLEAMRVPHFGIFRFHQDSVHDFASCLLTLQDPVGPYAEPQQPLGQVVLFCTVSVPLHLDAWLGEVSRLLGQADNAAGVLIIQDTDKTAFCRETSIIEGIETTRLSAGEVPFAYDQIVADMRRKYRWVLVLCPQLDQGPVTIFMSRSARHVFFITHLGKSELRVLESYQKALESPDAALQHALIFTT